MTRQATKLRRPSFLRRGFTLVEMLVIAPIVILAIGTFIGVIVNLTGEVLSSRGSNVLAYDVQDALNRIEEDIKLSTTYLATNNIAFTAGTNPQGYGANGSAANFTSIDTTGTGGSTASLILNGVVTNGNPQIITSSYMYVANAPNDCSDSTIYTKNTPLAMNVIYYVYQSALWRRVVLPTNYANTTSYCGSIAPWQRPTCQPGYVSTFCKTNDAKLIDGIDPADFTVNYYNAASASSPIAAATSTTTSARTAALQTATTVEVTINAKKTIAGRDLTRLGTLRASRLDTNATSIAYIAPPTVVPAAPAVSSKVSDGHTVTFTWPQVPTATSYSVDYRINGGAWTSGPTTLNNNSRTYAVTAGKHSDSVEARVLATNIIGNSSYGSTAATIPVWAPLALANGWTNFGTPYMPASYTLTKNNMVLMRGLVKNPSNPAANTAIATLPSDYAPASRLAFGTTYGTTNAAGRVDILSSGEVNMQVGNGELFSLDTVHYLGKSASYTRTIPTLENGFTSYGGTYAIASYAQDPVGRVFIQGMLSGGTRTSGTTIFTIPSALRPAKHQHHASTASGFSHVGIENNAGLIAKGDGTNEYSINSVYFPSSYSNWTSLTLQNGWVYNSDSGSIYSTVQYTKPASGDTNKDEIVMLKGLIKSGSTTSDSVIATLPAGYRPKNRIVYTTVSNSLYARVDILPNGEVRFMNGSNTWFSLDNILFLAEQ